MCYELSRKETVITSPLLLACLALAAAGAPTHAAWAGGKPTAPSFKPAAPAGGGVHLPGGAGGGVHLPGGMAGGAHLPGGMAGGAHLPGGMAGGAHLPGGMAGGAHMPSGMGGGAHIPQTAAAHTPESTFHAGAAGDHAAHVTHAGYRTPAAAARHEGEAGEHGRDTHEKEAHGHDEHGKEAGTKDAHERDATRADPRIGGRAALHTRLAAGAAVGLGAGLAAHHALATHFMDRPAARDLGHDRAFVAAHAADFHARYVRDFTPAEFGLWHGGFWGVGWHYGRLGWWWDVGGVYYPYAVPVYPYPLEVSALTVYGDDTVDLGYPVADAPSIPPLPAAPTGVYSCADPAGYFPTVQTCAQPWQLAEAAPER